MPKFDVASAYWNVAIDPDDAPYLRCSGVGSTLWICLGCVQCDLFNYSRD